MGKQVAIFVFGVTVLMIVSYISRLEKDKKIG